MELDHRRTLKMSTLCLHVFFCFLCVYRFIEHNAVPSISEQFREVLQDRRENAQRRGWPIGWNDESLKVTVNIELHEQQERCNALYRHLEHLAPGRLQVEVPNELEDAEREALEERNAVPSHVIPQLDGNDGTRLPERQLTVEVATATRYPGWAANYDPAAPPLVHLVGHPAPNVLIPLRCLLCWGPSSQVAIVGCGHICICADCCRDGKLALYFCPVCGGGWVSKTTGALMLQYVR